MTDINITETEEPITSVILIIYIANPLHVSDTNSASPQF